MVPATYITSTTGTPFDGAVFGNSAVFFPTKTSVTIATTTFTVPAAVTTFVVTGLTPGASYGVTSQTTAAGKLVTLTPGGSGYVADSAGLLKVAI